MPLNAVPYRDADPADGTPILIIGDVVDPVARSLLGNNLVDAVGTQDRCVTNPRAFIKVSCPDNANLVIPSARMIWESRSAKCRL